MKIYDCFTFYNELDLLEIRLNILESKIDYFVLVESTKTFSGEQKDLFFDKNKSRFDMFSNKIIHIVVNDMPVIKNGNRWTLEYFQRNAIMRGLYNCKDEDLILISDLDEIPNLENIQNIQNILQIKHKNSLFNIYLNLKTFFISNLNIKIIKIILGHFSIKSNNMLIFQQNLYYYYFNGFINNIWFGTRAVFYKDMVKQFKSSPQLLRESLSNWVVKNGGWHFSYLLSPEEISNKIKAFAHSEFDKPEHTDIKLIEKRIRGGGRYFWP